MTHKQFDSRKRITVYLSAEEYARIEALSNGNVSAYTRKILLAGVPHEENTIQDLPRSTDVHSPDRRNVDSSGPIAKLRESIPELKLASELPSKPKLEKLPALGESRSEAKRVGLQSGKKCKHGTGKGYHCWQCGGIAQIESAS